MYIQKYGENMFLYISKGFQSKLLGTNIAHLHKSSKAHTNSNHVNQSKKEGPFSVLLSTIQ